MTTGRRLSAKDRAVLRAAAKALTEEARVIHSSNLDYFTKRIEDRAVREGHQHYIKLVKQLVAIARTARSA